MQRTVRGLALAVAVLAFSGVASASVADKAYSVSINSSGGGGFDADVAFITGTVNTVEIYPEDTRNAIGTWGEAPAGKFITGFFAWGITPGDYLTWFGGVSVGSTIWGAGFSTDAGIITFTGHEKP